MSRKSSVYAVPFEIRSELDRLFIENNLTIGDGCAWLKRRGYDITKSSMGRYRKALSDGSEDLKLLAIGSRPLADLVSAAIAEGDHDLADLMHELISLQIRQIATMQRIQRYLRERQRKISADAWVEEQSSGAQP